MTTGKRYFESLKTLACEKREQYDVNTQSFGLRELRKIYKDEAIRIDSWPELPARIKAIYMCENNHWSVAFQPKLPKEPRLFAFLHELKHHYCDQDLLQANAVCCGDYNAQREIEIGAEIFAAEFIYPEAEFEADIMVFNSGIWTPEKIVEFKRKTSAVISYTFIRKRLERLGLIKRGEFVGVKFKKLEEKIYGVPFYRQSWFKEYRQRTRYT